MMSSRCPRPRGSMASIVVMPVSSGSVTGARSTIAGAGFSTGAMALARTLPSPSSGCPKRVHHATEKRVAHGDPDDRPRARGRSIRRGCPACGPSRMQPIDSSSSSTAMPRVPLANTHDLVQACVGKALHGRDARRRRARRGPRLRGWVRRPRDRREFSPRAPVARSPQAAASWLRELRADALDRRAPVRAPHARASTAARRRR